MPMEDGSESLCSLPVLLLLSNYLTQLLTFFSTFISQSLCVLSCETGAHGRLLQKKLMSTAGKGGGFTVS